MDKETYAYPDGAKYEGEWQNSKRHGRGIWTRPDGLRYEGEWENDKPNGQGTLTYPDGKKRSGLWENGKFIEEQQPVDSLSLSESDLKKCPYCGEQIRSEAIKCRYCQSNLTPTKKTCENKECQKEIDYDIWTCPYCKYVQHEGEKEEGMLTAGWIIGAILLPIVGIIGGIWGLSKKREGSGGLLAISIVIWIIWMIIFL